MNVKSLQKKLLLVTAGVSVVVGVSGALIWKDLKKATEALVQRSSAGLPSLSSSQEGKVLVKRVLIRRKIDASPDDLGEVIEEHLMATFPYDGTTRPPEVATTSPKKTPAAKEMANKLTMNQKIGLFGGLVAVFVGFNAWAIPKLRRSMGVAGGVPIFPPEMMNIVAPKGLFVDLACGEGLRLLEAAKSFDRVRGYDSDEFQSLKTLQLCSAEPKIEVRHLKSMTDAHEDVAKADLIFCNSVLLAQQSWPLTRSGGFLLSQDEISDAPSPVWKAKDMRLYKKD
jgi:hypothetical protein